MRKLILNYSHSKTCENMWRIVFLGLIVCISVSANAYNYVKGKVVDERGDPLPGVNVIEINTVGANGVITDYDGNYSIMVKGNNSILRYSFVGYNTQDIIVDNRTVLNVKMKEDTKVLDEVVVVGYGTLRKKDLSGSVSSLRNEDFMKSIPTSISQALQGKLAGVQVNSNDGQPGSGMSILIRGANSFSTNSQPLYIVDGIPFETGSTPTSKANENNHSVTNPLSLINPSDIESIDVLKDASATAIYGSRGANGVILITTKRGKKGQPRVEFSTNIGLSQIAKKVPFLDAYDYANYINEGTIFDGIYNNVPYTYVTYRGAWNYRRDENNNIVTSSGDYLPSPDDFLNPGYREDEYGNKEWIEGTNWMNEVLQRGFQQEYNLSASSATENSHYALSGNYNKQEGIIKNSGYERFAVRANIGTTYNDWLDLGLNINYTNATTNFAKANSYDYSILRSAMLYLPTIYYGNNMDDDTYFWLSANPKTYVNSAKDQLVSNNAFTSAYAQVNFTKWLNFRQNLGYNYNGNDRSTYYTRETGEGKAYNGRAGRSDNFYRNLTSESLISFNQTFNQIHRVNGVAGFTFENAHWGGKSINVSNFPTDVTGDYNLSQALTVDAPTSYRGESTLISMLGRINYTLDDRYILTASIRRDGSSRFAEGNKYATFPSGAIAWVVSEEDFLKNKKDLLSNLKLRFSYGKTGNQGINSYQTIASLVTSNYPLNGILYSGFTENTSNGPLNSKLRWETTDQFDAGLDFGFFKNSLMLTLDLYYKKTYDLLQSVSIPQSTGYNIMWTNSGNVKNKGMEIDVKYYAIEKKDWGLNFDANIAFNQNVIGGLDADQYANQLWYGATEVFIQRNGLPIGAMFGYVEDGFYDNLAEVRADSKYAEVSETHAQRMVGEIKYLDTNEDGAITTDDRVIIGNTNPDFIYGLTTNLRWKKFAMNLFFQGTYGNDIFNGNLMDIAMGSVANITKDAYETRWTPDNTAIAKWPRVTMSQTREWKLSNRYIEDGSYLKLKTINLSYSIGKIDKLFNDVLINVTVNNLFTMTKYSWYDPDVNAFGTDASRRGVDVYSYPSSRTFTFGVKITL